MTGRNLELAIKLKGKLDKSLPESVRKATAEAAELQKRMVKLNDVKIKAEKYQALTKEAQELGVRFSQTQKQAERLGTEFRRVCPTRVGMNLSGCI